MLWEVYFQLFLIDYNLLFAIIRRRLISLSLGAANEKFIFVHRHRFPPLNTSQRGIRCDRLFKDLIPTNAQTTLNFGVHGFQRELQSLLDHSYSLRGLLPTYFLGR